MEQTLLDGSRAELAALLAAVELHRPHAYDRYYRATNDAAEAVQWRCPECRESVTADGCRTWRTANGQ